MTAALVAFALAWTAASPVVTTSDAPRGRVGVLKFEGRAELPVRRQLQQALGLRGYEIVATRKLERTVRELGARLDDEADRRRVMTALQLTAIVRGRVLVAGGRAKAWLTIDREGEPSLERTWTVEGDGERLAEIVVSDWEHRPLAQPAPAQRAADAAVAASAEPPPKTTEPTTRRPDLSIAAGPRFLSRRLGFEGDSRGELRDYRTRSIGQALGIDVAWFPFTDRDDLARAVGFEASGEIGLGLRSQTSDGAAYDSPHHQILASIALRGQSRWVTAEAQLGGGEQSFAFEALGDTAATPGTRAPVPDVRYRYARAGGDLVVHGAGAFALLAGAGYRYAFDVGGIAGSAWFPRDRAMGFDARIGALVRVWPQWEVRAEAELARYSHAFGARPDDALVASGAVDVYVDYRLSIAFVFDAAGARR